MTEITLPFHDELERLILGWIFLHPSHLDFVRSSLDTEDFSLEKHRRIWNQMCVLYDSGRPVDSVTVAEELRRAGRLESIDGLSYLVSLYDGLPDFPSVDDYVVRLRESTMRRRLIRAGQRLAISAADESNSTDGLVSEMEKTLIEVSNRSNGNRPISTREMIETEGLQSLLSPRGLKGIQLPWKRLNEALSGLDGGQLVVLMAATSRGKTSLALQICTCAAAQGLTPVTWTMEMSPREMFRKMAVQLSGVYPKRLLTFEERSALLDAGAKLGDEPLYFDSHSRNVGSFLGSLRQVRAKGRVGLGVVDYLQLIRGSGKTRAQEVSENSRALKLAAMDMELPLLVLSQVDRSSVKGEGKIGLHSAKESGDIENDADVVLWIDAPELSRDQDTMVSLHVGKQRDGPAGFSIPMVFRPTSQTFLEVNE